MNMTRERLAKIKARGACIEGDTLELIAALEKSQAALIELTNTDECDMDWWNILERAHAAILPDEKGAADASEQG